MWIKTNDGETLLNLNQTVGLQTVDGEDDDEGYVIVVAVMSNNNYNELELARFNGEDANEKAIAVLDILRKNIYNHGGDAIIEMDKVIKLVESEEE